MACIKYFSPSEVQLSGYAPILLPMAPISFSWPLCTTQFASIPLSLIQAILSSSALAICNVSYMPHQYQHLAISAWILHSGSLPGHTCHRVTQVHGPSSSINSYCTELQGMYTLLLALVCLCSQHDIHMGHITIGCNNKGVLSLVQHPWPYVSCLLKHHNLLQAILNTCHLCPLTLSFQYVAGHQDDFSCFDDLPLLAQLNIQANSLAKQASPSYSWLSTGFSDLIFPS